MLGEIYKYAPHVFRTIMKELVGSIDGEGDASSGIVREAELRYNAGKGVYWYREMQPDDDMISTGTANTYHATMTTVTEEDILATGNPITVQNAEAVICFGWYCETDLGRKGYLKIEKNNNTYHTVPAQWVWRQKDPEHCWFALDTVIKAFEQEKLNFTIYNAYGSDRVAVAIPILFRIAERPKLGLRKPYNR